jgi:hypothetical protein
VTFRLVAKCLNQLGYRVPPYLFFAAGNSLLNRCLSTVSNIKAFTGRNHAKNVGIDEGFLLFFQNKENNLKKNKIVIMTSWSLYLTADYVLSFS